QEPARLVIRQHDQDDRLRPLLDQSPQLPWRADVDPPARQPAQGSFDTRGIHRVLRDDDRRPGSRLLTHVVLAAASLAVADATKRRTSLIGIASARPPAIIVFMPTTFPAESARGPPELPGARRTSAWMKRRPPGRTGPTACTTPAVSVRRNPRG